MDKKIDKEESLYFIILLLVANLGFIRDPHILLFTKMFMVLLLTFMYSKGYTRLPLWGFYVAMAVIVITAAIPLLIHLNIL